MSGIFDKVKTGVGKVAFEADKIADVKKAQLDIAGLKRQMDSIYNKLGEMTYQRYSTTGQESPEFTEVCQSIQQIEQKIAAKEEEIKQINARVYQPSQPTQTAYTPPPSYTPPPQQQPAQQYTPPPQQAQPQKNFCPNCGAEIDDSTKFCSNCGTKIA